jgi:tetratricopeptide (TPR) repeat protein
MPRAFPVAEPFGLCDDEAVIGTPFYVMDMVEGRIFWDASFPEVPTGERARYFDAMNATVAALHAIDPDAAGLGDYGKPGNYFERQIGRWSKQYLGDAEAGRVPAMDRLVEWLPAHLPPDEPHARIIHGDYRCDNMIFHPSEPRVLAVLDWELSTLGHPLADFSYHLMMYRMPPGITAGLAGLDLPPLNIPSEEEYVAAYCRRTARDGIPTSISTSPSTCSGCARSCTASRDAWSAAPPLRAMPKPRSPVSTPLPNSPGSRPAGQALHRNTKAVMDLTGERSSLRALSRHALTGGGRNAQGCGVRDIGRGCVRRVRSGCAGGGAPVAAGQLPARHRGRHALPSAIGRARPGGQGMFDRAYSIVCRDAAQPVGRIYALRKTGDPLQRLAELRRDKAACDGSTSQPLNELKAVSVAQCKLAGSEVAYRVYSLDRGKTVYVAEGLAGYDSALTLGLRTVVADRIIPGEVVIAATEAGDPAAFARVQAGSLDLARALDEGYRRNNSGNYAEAAEFFDTLLQRAQSDQEGRRYLGEYLINRALQRSNLGAFAEADGLFLQADAIPTSDPVQLRLRRNFRALHLMNQQKFGEASLVLARRIDGDDMVSKAKAATEPVIDVAAAEIINSSMPIAQQLTGMQGASLSAEERAQILDAQAQLLSGSILRRQGQPARPPRR